MNVRVYTKFFSIAVVSMLGTPVAFAQGEQPEEVTPEESAAAESAAPESEEAEPQVSEVHSVQEGDTLWDLCNKYLNSPWYWPKIWSYNPQITNAHWIYPGNEIRFYPSDENASTQIEPQVEFDEPAQDTELYEDDSDLVRTVNEDELNAGKGLVEGSFLGQHVAFVSARDHDIAGQVQNSVQESQMLSDYDTAYVKFKAAPKKGQPYAVYRTLKPIDHPITGEPYGYVIEIVGGVTVIDTSPTVATVMIKPTYRPIERGDFVGPWPETVGQRVEPVPNSAEAKGYIVETLEAVLTQIGEYHVVFIDRGREHGVQIGNTFKVYNRGDGFTEEVEGLPNEVVGELMIIDVQEKSSTALVTKSAREIAVGDKVEMSVSRG